MNTKRALILLSIPATFLGGNVRGQNVVAWGANTQGQCDVPPAATNIIGVAAGGTFSVGLRSDGTVISWGVATNPPADLANATQIAAGYNHCLALKADGTVVAWGDNSQNQLAVPPSATNVIAIAAGYYHGLALRNDGTVVAWGRNVSGQCNVPPGLTNVIAVAAGLEQSTALKSDGTLVGWGKIESFPESQFIAVMPFRGTPVLAIGAGPNHDLAIRPGGRVNAWGDGSFRVTRVPKGLTNVVAVAGGTNFSLVLKADGHVQAWGFPPATNIPPSASYVMAISAGPLHCLAITSAPPVLGHVGTYRGRIPVGSAVPVFALTTEPCQWYRDGVAIPGATNAYPQIPALLGSDNAIYSVVVSNSFGMVSNIAGSVAVGPIAFWGDSIAGQGNMPFTLTNTTSLAAGGFHCLALNADGTVVAWGKNTSGQTNVPANATNIVKVAAGSDHSLALRQDGNIIAWGRDWDGQTDVPPSATNVVSIAAGWAHSVALRADGSVICWGNNDLDQTNVPVLLANAMQVVAGYYHTVALKSDHTVVSWGLYSAVPAAATNVVAIAAGFGHTLALRADGSVIAWGDNYYGQATVPPAATNIVAIAAGYYHSVALRADGAVFAWGKGYYGVTNVPGLPAMTTISAGEDFTVGLPAVGLPQITKSPNSLVVHVGGEAIFTADATGAQPLAFQWLYNGAPIPNATNRFLIVDHAQFGDGGSYAILVTNLQGQTTSGAANLTVLRDPYITTSPPYTSILIGQSFCLAASVTGEQPISFQWRRNGIPLSDDGRISGSTSSVLCISSSDFIDGGDYQLVLDSTYGGFTGLVTHVSITPIIAWGDDFAGELDIPPDTGEVIAVAAGSDHSLALRADGRVVAWGDNTFGQTSVPPSATNIVAIAAYGAQSIALTAYGIVLAWGENRNGLTNVPSGGVQIATSDTHSMVARSDGSVKTWGLTGPWSTVPNFQLATLAIAAGPFYSLRLDGGGNLTSYGLSQSFGGSGFRAISAGRNYIMGMKATNVIVHPLVAVNGGFASDTVISNSFAAIAVGDNHLLFLATNGTPFCIGDNSFGQTNTPVVATNVVATAAGANHNLALLGNGRPVLAQQSSTRTFTLGDATILVAPTIGNAPATYQWQLNGTNIPMATTSYLLISPIRWTNSGTYRVVISDAFGSVLGPATVLNVLAPVLQFDMSASGFSPTYGIFHVHILGASGTASTILYSSPDLIHWSPFITNRPPRGAFDIVGPTFPDQPQMFYRIAEVYNQ